MGTLVFLLFLIHFCRASHEFSSVCDFLHASHQSLERLETSSCTAELPLLSGQSLTCVQESLHPNI